jgi:hypothetical protein
MTAVLLTEPLLQFFDDNGDPLSGGKIYTYAAGTTTPKATYTAADGLTPNANPVILDAAGRAAIWISGSYKIVVKTSADVTISTTDNITSFASGAVGTTVTDTGFTVQNASDLTKQFQFLLSGLTTGTTTVGTVPDGNFTFGTKANIDARVTIAAMTDKVLYGLTLSNNGSDATNDIDIAAGACVSDDGTTIMTLSAITKRLDASWAVGTNQGGLDTGSIANATYHLWVINRPDTNVTDVLFSTSASSPTMPSNYTKKKCIGSIVRASAAILAFDQHGNEFILDTPVLDHSTGATAGTSAITATLSSLPTGVKLKAMCNGLCADNGNNVYVSSLDSADVAASASAAPLATFGSGGTNFTGQFSVWTNTSAQVRTRQATNSANGFKIATLGWRDPRI